MHVLRLASTCEEADVQKLTQTQFVLGGKTVIHLFICHNADNHTVVSHVASRILERNFSFCG